MGVVVQWATPSLLVELVCVRLAADKLEERKGKASAKGSSGSSEAGGLATNGSGEADDCGSREHHPCRCPVEIKWELRERVGARVMIVQLVREFWAGGARSLGGRCRGLFCLCLDDRQKGAESE